MKRIVELKRGRKSDTTKISSAVDTVWGKIDKMIRKELKRELPTRRADAKKHVLRVASGIIATNIRTRRTSGYKV